MRLLATLTSLTAALLIAAPLAPADRPDPEVPETPPAAFVPDRVIVQWAPGADRGDRVDARAEADVAAARSLGDPNYQVLRIGEDQTVAGAIAALESDPAVVVAERDGLYAPHGVPNDPLFGALWGLRNAGGALGVGGFPNPVAGADVSALGAWVRTVGAPSAVVAVIDTGYRFEHPDLGAVAWTNPGEGGTANGTDDDDNGIVDDLHGADFVGPNPDALILPTDGNPADDNLLSGGHGTHVAGTVGGTGGNGVGISGVAQNVRMMPLRVCAHSATAGDARCPVSSQIAAINYAGAKGARVANMSLGGTTYSQAAVNAIAANPQTLFVISAGNDGDDNESVHHYPCDYRPTVDASPPGPVDNIVCVAATDQADGLATFSDYGAVSVDLGAPGTEILSAYPYDFLFGESFADGGGFGTEWPATGANGGFQRTAESPLTSFGITDVVGPPVASQVRETTSAAFDIPANGGGCKLRQTRRVVLSPGDSYRYSLLLNGVEQVASSPAATSGGGLERRFVELPAAFNAGGSAQIRFRFTTGPVPAAGSGVWLDDIDLDCPEPVGGSTGYGLLQGTSMAAPHVAGAAALLFSYEPSASVTEVRDALLDGVDPVQSLAGKTVTGGRLNASDALDLFDEQPPAAPLLTAPASPANDNAPLVGGSAEELAEIRLYANAGCAGSPVAVAEAAILASPGIAVTVPDNTTTTFSATATDSAANTSACSAAITYVESTPPPIVGGGGTGGGLIGGGGTGLQMPKPLGCRVPKLAKLPLAKAKALLGVSNCALGKVSKPKKKKKGQRKLPPLVVKSSTPKAGTELAAGAKVAVKLGPKPKPKKRKRR